MKYLQQIIDRSLETLMLMEAAETHHASKPVIEETIIE